MKSTDERMVDVLGRAKAREAMVRRQRQRAVAVGGGVLSVVLVVLVGIGVSTVMEPSGSASLMGKLGLMGSVLAGGPALGYVVVGLLGIALGAAVTALVYRFGRRPSGEPRDVAPTHSDGEGAAHDH